MTAPTADHLQIKPIDTSEYKPSIYHTAASTIINNFMAALSVKPEVLHRVKDEFVNAPFIGIPINKEKMVQFLKETFGPYVEAQEKPSVPVIEKAPDYVPPSPAIPTPEAIEEKPDEVEEKSTLTIDAIVAALGDKKLRTSELAEKLGVPESEIRKLVMAPGSGLKIKQGGRVSRE